MSPRSYHFTVRGKVFEGGTHIMGILNATPDSFFEGSRVYGEDACVRAAGAQLADGAEILDIGGQSTRPCAEQVSAEEEARRVIPIIRALRSAYPLAPISVDTFYASVAEEAAKAGADMINDVSCLSDEGMAEVMAKFGLAALVMHNRRGSKVEDMFEDKISGLGAAVRKLLQAGVDKTKIMLDGGIGFNLSRAEDVRLLTEYDRLIDGFEYPFLLGASRKSFLGGLLAEDRLPATLDTTALAARMGALFIRVHDVKQNAEILKNLKLSDNYNHPI